jgi:MarR family transcriptional regulator, organic hydroperoxide resistance regulator
MHFFGRKQAARHFGAERSAIVTELKLEGYFPYLINRVGFALVERFERDALKRHHLSIAMWRVLAALSNNGEQRQIDLSQMTSIEVSTLSRIVTRLVRMGLVARARSKMNNREVLVSLSAKGRALVERLIPIAKKLEQDAIGGLPRGELDTMRDTLRQMYKNLTRSIA